MRYIALPIVSLFLVVAFAATSAHAAYVLPPDVADEYVRARSDARARPNDPATVFEYAVCLAYVGKIEEGRKALRKVRALDPEFAARNLPRYLQDAESRPSDVHALFRVAFLHYFTGDNERAYKAFDTIAKHPPPSHFTAWALAYMAVIRSDSGKWDEAESLVRRALELEPDAYGLHAAHAAALRGQGRIFAATGAFFRALNLRAQFENYEREHFPAPEDGKN